MAGDMRNIDKVLIPSSKISLIDHHFITGSNSGLFKLITKVSLGSSSDLLTFLPFPSVLFRFPTARWMDHS